ncbi:MAG: hypothetical protein ACM3OG_02005 [Actinomycetota bacterium]
MSALFAFKLTLVPFFILALSLAARRWGTAVSGWLVALPIVAGPIVFFIGMEQGEAFAAGAARSTIAGLASLAVYSLVYCRAALRAGWAPSLLAGWAGFFLSTVLLNRVPLTLPVSIALALAALVAAYLLLPAVDPEASPPGMSPWEIAARMAAAVGMVLLMTALARPLGPRLAGLLVPFPVAATVLTVFTHRYHGGASAIRLLRGLVAGLWTMGVFFLVVAVTVERLGVGVSFMLAASVDIACNGGSLWALRRIRASRSSSWRVRRHPP